MPDFETRPTGPLPAMVWGVMPASDSSGVMMPGQFGPIIRVDLPSRYCTTSAVSRTGTPSVMTTRSGISASMASMQASLVKAGGTKATDTSAPVSFMASSTVPKTGSSLPPSSTVVPALRALTPPTMFAPDSTMRVVCLAPMPPVMPWTMILESLLR
ncbi:unannotated protein [freshwater metagenome]|uniref:Unannotated protein n=1 Tax=freshwater metagenome TaxID=449393 RepID=A0A6J7KEP9_9ZZZZ